MTEDERFEEIMRDVGDIEPDCIVHLRAMLCDEWEAERDDRPVAPDVVIGWLVDRLRGNWSDGLFDLFVDVANRQPSMNGLDPEQRPVAMFLRLAAEVIRYLEAADEICVQLLNVDLDTRIGRLAETGLHDEFGNRLSMTDLRRRLHLPE